MRATVIVLSAAVLAVGLVGGCDPATTTGNGNTNGTLDDVEIDFDLGDGLGVFTVEAGVPMTLVGTGSFTLTGASATGGVFILDPANVTVTPNDTTDGKWLTSFQAADPLQVTILVDGIEDVETVCTDGEQYGPYSITLDENNVPVSISPSEITLSADTIALLNAGEFSICLGVLSPISGTVQITTLTFSVTPVLD